MNCESPRTGARVPVVLTAVATLATLFGATGCGSTRPLVVPCDVESFYLFEQGHARLVTEGGSETRFPLGLRGAPACTAWDFSTGVGVAAYEDGFARIYLEEEDAPLVHAGDAWAKKPTSIGIADGIMAVLAGSGSGAVLDVRRVEDGSRLWMSGLESWMDDKALDRVVFAMPVAGSEGERFVLVATAGQRVIIERVDRSRRPWVEEARTEIRDLHRLQAWAADGQSVYLAGVHERESGGGRNQMGSLDQTLLVYRFDAGTLEKRELMRRSTTALSTRVDRISVASDLAALTLNGDRVEVYRVGDDALEHPPLDRQQFPHTVEAVCTSADSIVISSAGAPIARSYGRD